MPTPKEKILLTYQNGKNVPMEVADFEKKKDKLYKDNPTLQAYRISQYDRSDEDITDNDSFLISSAEDEPFQVDSKRFRENRDELYSYNLKGLQVQKIRPVDYFGEQGEAQKKIIDDRLSAIRSTRDSLSKSAESAYKAERESAGSASFGRRLLDAVASAGRAAGASPKDATGYADPSTYTGWLNTNGKEAYGDSIKNYQAAESLLQDAQAMQNQMLDGDVSGAEGLLNKAVKTAQGNAQGVEKWAKDPQTWSDVVSGEVASSMYGLQQKITKIFESLPDDAKGEAIEKAIRKGLNESELALFDAVQASGAVTSVLAPKLSASVKAGEIMAESARMGVEFFLFHRIAGASGQAVKRNVSKYLAKRLLSETPSKLGRKVAKGVAGYLSDEAAALVSAGFQTLAAPSGRIMVAQQSRDTMQAFMASPAQFMNAETRAAYGIKGPQQLGEMTWDGAISVMVENATEFGLGPVNKILGAVGKAGYRGLRKLGWNKLATLLSPKVSAALEKAGIHGLFEETGEEVNNAIIDYFRGNKDAIKDFFEMENLSVLAASFALPILGGAGVSAVQRGVYKNKYSTAYNAYVDYLVKNKVSADGKHMSREEAEAIANSVNGSSPEELGHKAALLLNALDQSKNSTDKGTEAQLILDLLKTARDYNAANGVNELILAEERERTREEILTKTGNRQFWQTHEARMTDDEGMSYVGEEETVDVITTKGDNNYFVTKEYADGSVETVDERGVVTNFTAQEIKSGLADGSFTSRRTYGIDDYFDLRNGTKKDAVWEVSEERVSVLSAYRAGERQGVQITHDDAYSTRQAVNAARVNALALGIDEAALESAPEEIARTAFQEREAGNIEVAEALSDYATAKAAEDGLLKGYTDSITGEYNAALDSIVSKATHKDGTLILATSGEGEGALPVYVLSADAVVARDGSLNVIGGDSNSLVRVMDTTGVEMVLRASTLSDVQKVDAEGFKAYQKEVNAEKLMQDYEDAATTISLSGKMEALAPCVNHTILVQGQDGTSGSLTILSINFQDGTVIVKNSAAKGEQRAIPIGDLYDMALKDENGEIKLDPTTPDNKLPEVPKAPAEGAQQVPAAPQAPASQPADIDLQGTQTIYENGQPKEVEVTEVTPEGQVLYTETDENGKDVPKKASKDEFVKKMQAPAPAPAQNPEPEKVEEKPAAVPSKLPMKNGEVDWANLFNVDDATFAERLPEIVELMRSTLGANAQKEAQKSYAAKGEEIKKAQEKINKNSDLSKAPALYKALAELEQLRKNYGALVLALSPKQETTPAPVPAPAESVAETPEAPVEDDVPDVSKDTPEAAQQRGYVKQNGNRIDRSTPDAIVAEGKETKVAFTKNEIVDGKYGLVDAARIVPSHVSDQENILHFFAQRWQPKDRNRKDSAVAIQQMANNLRPEEITQGATAYVGAPIVNARGEVIQGNGRGEALRRAYAQKTADGYKAWLAEHAGEFGLTREQVEGMENPILVRVLDVDDATAEKLGQKEQKDLESGGDQIFNGRTLAGKLGGRLGEVMEILFGGELGEDATPLTYINKNGHLALDWLHAQGFINDTEYQNCFTGNGKDFTDAAKLQFQDLCLAPYLAGAQKNMEDLFASLPNHIKLALQQCVALVNSLDGVVADIQTAIQYYHDFESDAAFATAKDVKGAQKAISAWLNSFNMEDNKTEGERHPSAAARGFAALFKGVKTKKALVDLLKALGREMNGVNEVFESKEGVDRITAYKNLGIITEDVNTENNGGQQGIQGPTSGGNESGPTGGRGSTGRPTGNGNVSAGSEGARGRNTDGGRDTGGVEGNAPTAEKETEKTVSSQKETKQEPAAPKELTEDEIRNSGYPDEDVIDAAVDYINGDKSFSNTSAYNLVKEYVRSQRTTTQSAGRNADGAQLDGPVVQPTGVGAERSGSEAGGLDRGAQGGATERIPGNQNGSVPIGEGGSAAAAGVGLRSDVQNTGGDVNRGRDSVGEHGRSHDVGGRQGEAPQVPGEPTKRQTETGAGALSGERPGRADVGRGVSGISRQDRQAAGGVSSREGTVAGSTDIAALGGELADLLKQFGETEPSIDRDINGLDSVSYSVEPEQKKEGALSTKRPKTPTAPLSLEGLTPKQQEIAGKIIFTSAKLGYAYAKTEGLTTFNDFARWFKTQFGDAVKKGLNYDESSLNAFIGEVWNTKMKVDGTRLTLEKHNEAMRDAENREEGKYTLKERAERQRAANEKKVPFKAANRKNIAEALPQLTPGQWDDMVMIERQFFDPSHNDYDHAYGKGMLITNGTGTGKTYTGLGTIKRFVDQGKKRILLVAPAVMTTEWVVKGNEMGIKMRKLNDTKDKGQGVVVTSYENFRENLALLEDDFDLVVYDECHNIIENQRGEDTKAYEAHKKITNKNIEEATERLLASTIPGRRRLELEKEQKAKESESRSPKTKQDKQIEISQRLLEIASELNQLKPQIDLLKPTLRERAEEAVKKTKVLFLSATPFNTIENLKYAEGYIYQYPKIFKADGTEITGEESRKSAFMTDWFRGEEPMEELEVAFGDHLLDELETVSFRGLENGYDNSRDFPDVSGNIMASRFNQAWQSIMRDPRFNALSQTAMSLFKNYTWTTQLFETMKISAMRDRLQEHLNAGRKIVIFHDRMHESRASDRVPPVGPPFATILDLAMQQDNAPIVAITEFRREFADILKWEAGLDYRPVQEQVIDFYATDADRAKYAKKMEEYDRKMEDWHKACDDFIKAHPIMSPEELEEALPKAPKRPQLEAESVATYNGEKSDAEKTRAKDAFNDDNSKVKIICVTTASGGAGLSLHDTTGKFPRVMIQTALPNSPIRFIQAEGRIFRWGNRSNAVFEYPRLGLDIEAITFAMSFNAKAETTENLAHGFRGRGLKDSIMTGFYENSGNVPLAGQGIGGVEMDKRGNTLKGMAKAKHDYGVAQRKGIKAGDKSIPEPVGYVMTTWGKMQSGEQSLIPFAGRGSISRYMPKGTGVSVLEQDIALQADLMVTSASDGFKLREGTFAELNPINKADVVILNGNTDGGMNQYGALEKGFSHLSEGGRLIAVVPNDPLKVAAAIRSLGEQAVLRSTVIVGNPAIDAGTEGTSRIVVVDKISKPAMRSQAGTPSVHDLSLANKEDLPGLLEQVQMPERIVDKQAIAIKKIKSVLTELRKNRMFSSIDVFNEDKADAYLSFLMADRFPTGVSRSRYRFDSLNDKRSYWTGKYFDLYYSDFERVSADNALIKSYQWLKEVVAAPDEELRERAIIERSASQETVDNVREMYRQYMKLIRAGFGLSEAQIQRVANGLRPEISAGDIETLNSYEELRAKFEATNKSDEERQELYDKVAAVGEKIGLTIGAEAMDRDFLGGYNNVDNSLKVNKNRWNGLSDEKRATTLLHEFIHSVTVYALAGYNTNAMGMSDALSDAAKLAVDVYNQITIGSPQDVRPFTGQYAIENEKELLAEMANNATREKLKNRRMWVARNGRDVFVSGYEIEGAEQTTAWALLSEALDGMLKNFDKSLFDRFRGRVSDFFFEVDRNGVPTREADHGVADTRTNGGAVISNNNVNFVSNDSIRGNQTENRESSERKLGAISGDSNGSGSGSLGKETAEAERQASVRRLDVFQRGLAAERVKYLEESNRTGRDGTDVANGNAGRNAGRTAPDKAAADALIKLARENGAYIETSELRDRFGHEYHKQGFESITLISEDGKVFTKLKDPFRVGTKFDKTHSTFDVINEVIAHNILFPDTAYNFIGVTIEGHKVRLVLQQDAIPHNTHARRRQMAAWFTSRGFNFGSWDENGSDENVRISDADLKNACVTPNGGVRVFDPIIHFLVDPDTAITRLRRKMAGHESYDITAKSNEHPLIADVVNACEKYFYECDDYNSKEKSIELYEMLVDLRKQLNNSELGSIEDYIGDDIERILEDYKSAQKAAQWSRFFAEDLEGLYAVAAGMLPLPKVTSVVNHEKYREDPDNARLRQKEDPKKTVKVYKLMRLGEDGKLYPLFIDSSAPISLGRWYDADSPSLDFLKKMPSGVFLVNPKDGTYTSLEDYQKQHGEKKTKYPSKDAVNAATEGGLRWVYIEDTEGGQKRYEGENRKYWNIGINGSGSVSTFAMRPGWHAGSLPTMRQIGKGPQKNLRDDKFVWVEGEVSADVDYNEEAQGNPDNDIPTHIPADGFYMKSTNANAKAAQADKVGWYVAGSFKANRIISDAEARQIIDEYNANHPDQEPVQYDYGRESGGEYTPSEAVNYRITEAELKVVDKRLDTMSKELGIKINRISRNEMPIGHRYDKGFYDPKTGEMTICMDNVTDERDAIATVLHETVGHHGLRKLLGDQFRTVMARLYASLDADGRKWVNSYIARHPKADNVLAVEEYLSYLAESADFKSSVWDRIKAVFDSIIRKIFGSEDFTFTNRELQYLLRASYENLKDPNWLSTVKGKAKDVLLRRESEKRDENDNNDDSGPLYRDADTAVARSEKRMKDFRTTIRIENQDADHPVRIAYEEIQKETGKKEIDESEDYLQRHNLASSRAESEAHEFELFHFKPLVEQVFAIRDRLLGKKADNTARVAAYERVLDYIYAVSGLERNAYKNNEIEQKKQLALADAKTPEEVKEIEEKYEAKKRDWSGITSLMGRPRTEWVEAEADAKAMIDAFKSEVGNDALLNELWDRIRSCTDYSLEHAYKHGLLTRDEFERLHGTDTEPPMWEHYVPLRGFKAQTAEEEYDYGYAGIVDGGAVVEKANGRWTEASNPIANILNIAEREIVQGNDNWAKQALYRFVLSAGENTLLSDARPWYVKDDEGNWMLAEPYEKDPSTGEPETLEHFETRMKAMRENIQPDGTHGEPKATRSRKDLSLDKIMANKGNRAKHVIRLRVNGAEKMIWVNGNPAIAKAVSGIGQRQGFGMFRRASRTLSNLFTTYSLDFTAKNLLRDSIYSRMALLTKEDRAYRSQFRKNWWRNFGYGLFAAPMIKLASEWESGKLQKKANPTEREQAFMEFMRNGGQTGYTIVNSVSQIKKDLERSMRKAKMKEGVRVPVLGHYANAVKTLNEAFELLTRFTTFQTSRDMGRSGQRAASDAKEISVNFNRRGAQTNTNFWGGLAAYLGATSYFYNASVQGFQNFLHLFKVNPVKMRASTAGVAMLGILTPMVNSMLSALIGGGGDDDDWYWNLPDWVRRNNIVLGFKGCYLALPLPVELRAFYAIGDITGSAFMYQKYPNRNGWNVAGDMVGAASNILPVNPLEGFAGEANIAEGAIRAVAPDILMFGVDWAFNRDYTGRPLSKENPFTKTAAKSQGAFASTPKALTEACVAMGKATGIDVPPGYIRNLFNHFGGGFYRAAEDVSKLITGAFGSDPERPLRYDDIPFFSGFSGHIDQDRSNTFVKNALYEYKDIAESVVHEINVRTGGSYTMSDVYDHPEDLPATARVQTILAGERYILGQMYREGMNNKGSGQYHRVTKQYQSGKKKGQWYTRKEEIKNLGVEALEQEWKKARSAYGAVPKGDEEAKAEARLQMEDAWHKYYDAAADLVDRLMDEEYHHAELRRKNGIVEE